MYINFSFHRNTLNNNERAVQISYRHLSKQNVIMHANILPSMMQSCLVVTLVSGSMLDISLSVCVPERFNGGFDFQGGRAENGKRVSAKVEGHELQ